MATKEDKEPFVSRWSRLKQEAREQQPQKAPDKLPAPEAPAPELPPIDKLTLESDYRAFFHPKVNEDVRRAALRKLFSDPHFNVMDGLDVYIDDYTKPDPVPAAMLAQLRQAQKILESPDDGKEPQRKVAPRVEDARVPPALGDRAPSDERPHEEQPPTPAASRDAPEKA